jgi:uncharacterized protein YcfJ
MKTSYIFAVALGLAAAPVVMSSPAQAIGCLSGGAAGAVAGHYAGHHGVVGAIGGCIVGHHMHKKQMREERTRRNDYQQQPQQTY